MLTKQSHHCPPNSQVEQGTWWGASTRQRLCWPGAPRKAMTLGIPAVPQPFGRGPPFPHYCQLYLDQMVTLMLLFQSFFCVLFKFNFILLPTVSMFNFSVFSLTIWASVFVVCLYAVAVLTFYRNYFITSQDILIFTYKNGFLFCLRLVSACATWNCCSPTRGPWATVGCSPSSSRKLRLTHTLEKTVWPWPYWGTGPFVLMLQPMIQSERKKTFQKKKKKVFSFKWCWGLGSIVSLRSREGISGRESLSQPRLALRDACEKLVRGFWG